MKTEKVNGYLEFKGPSVDEGKMDAGEAGRALLAISKLFDAYVKSQKKDGLREELEFKINSLKKSSTEIGICLQEIAPIAKPLVSSASALLIAETIGLRELGKSFFATVGEQLALKIFAKGKSLKEESQTIQKNNVMVLVRNAENETQLVSQNGWKQYNSNQQLLRDLTPLAASKTESVRIGYYEAERKVETGRVEYGQKRFFNVDEDYPPARERFDEDFKEQEAIDVKLVGQFMDFYGRAQKYHFSFQARKQQDEVGRQYILCIVPQDKIDELIDYLKPSHRKNVCIFGMATKDHEGRIDKIKVQFISEDEDFNPSQVTLLK